MKRMYKTMKNLLIISLLVILWVACESDEPNGDGIGKIEAVDLGLSVKWASCNIGAYSPEQYGHEYAWGETSVKDEYTPINYVHWTDNNGDGTNLLETYELDHSEFTNIGKISGTEYDVAHVKWGDGWRMPTLKDYAELLNDCIWEKGSYKGSDGYYITGPNGNSIFLPCSEKGGFNYWTDECHWYYMAYAYVIDRSSSYLYCGRYMGLPVRAVKDYAEVTQ